MKNLKKWIIVFLLALFLPLSISCEGEDENENSLRTPNQNILVTGTVGEAVDMGLSVQWADHNVGAFSPEDIGIFYAWGETEGKVSYTKYTYIYYLKESDDYQSIGKDICGTKRDVAKVMWKGKWRMPTKAEIEELINLCSLKFTSRNGVRGCLLTAQNGNSLFLPISGYMVGTNKVNIDQMHYWSGSLHSVFHSEIKDMAGILDATHESAYDFFTDSRESAIRTSTSYENFCGKLVRPVKEY